MLRSVSAAAVALTLWLAALPAAGQTPDLEAREVEGVVITAQRAGAPIWRLTRGAGTVVLVGAIDQIPGATPWRPAALEAAIAKADAVILEPEASGSVVDLGRLLFGARSILYLPEGETVASRFGADLDRRLGALAAAGKIDKGYRRLRPTILFLELLDAANGPHGRKLAPEVNRVAQRAAKRARIPQRPLLRAPARTLIEDLKRDSPDDLRCLGAATDAAEEGPAGALRRGRAWTERRVPDVRATALQRAHAACAFSRSGTVGDAVRAAWRNTVERELSRPGVVVGVAPLEIVAGPNGILDTLGAQGVTIHGPRWRSDPTGG